MYYLEDRRPTLLDRARHRPSDGDERKVEEALPRNTEEILRRTDRTLGQILESIIGAPPDLEVVAQWRLSPPLSAWLSPPLSADAEILGRCTSYRMRAVRLSRNLSYVDLDRSDPTLAALLETKQLNLGQLFVDPKIDKRNFEFGTHEGAGEIDSVFRTWFSTEEAGLQPYVWRRYQAAIRGVVAFVVIEALPTETWERLLEAAAAGHPGRWRSGPRWRRRADAPPALGSGYEPDRVWPRESRSGSLHETQGASVGQDASFLGLPARA